MCAEFEELSAFSFADISCFIEYNLFYLYWPFLFLPRTGKVRHFVCISVEVYVSSSSLCNQSVLWSKVDIIYYFVIYLFLLYMNIFINRYYIQISIFEISFFVIKFRKISPPCQLTVNIHLGLLAYF